MAESVRDFVKRAYQLVSANSPTIPLRDGDFTDGLYYFNNLLDQYGGNALLLTVPKVYSQAISAGTNVITFDETVTPGRLSNILSCWLESNGTTYYLERFPISVFEDSYRYAPLTGLPQYAFFSQNLTSTQITLYPSPDKGYTFNLRGKFSVQNLLPNDTLDELPAYAKRFYLLALARELAIFKSRNEAWTPDLESRYLEAKKEMVSLSPINLTLRTTTGNFLNGAARVRSGT